MSLFIHTYPVRLQFKQPAGTSRGVYTYRDIWYVTVSDTTTGNIGIGECAPLPDLSCDRGPNYYSRLLTACQTTEHLGYIDYDMLSNCPSILMGLETAFRHLQTRSFKLFDNSFTRGEMSIQINGLVWMGNYDEMLSRIAEKQEKGFKCIKLKIGAINFKDELKLIEIIRSNFTSSQIELRVDANGAFNAEDAMTKIKQLAKYDIHSIEQPIKPAQWDKMNKLCCYSPIPIALDEELIGINNTKNKKQLLSTIRPQYLVLKPSLHGGFHGSEEWISLAELMGIKYWVTSALESNIGLNAIAQWTAEHSPTLPQGLGTGQLFTDNFPTPLTLIGEQMCYDNSITPSPSDFIKWAKNNKQ
ncbi:MAG: o-succinylbenzoate synthase [Bacteroidales bacterium]|nr:o-succinylbenzoate synthase [Bacteroidales bacterium]